MKKSSIIIVAGRRKKYRLRALGADGKIKIKHFETLEEAQSAQREATLDADMPSDYAVGGAERSFIASLRRLCAEKQLDIHDAEKIALEAVRAHQTGASVSVSDALERYFEDCKARNLRAASIKYYGAMLHKAARLGAWEKLGDITRESVAALYARERSPHMRRSLGTFLEWARRCGLSDGENTARQKLDEVRGDVELPRILSPDEMRTLLSGVAPSLATTVALMAFAGVRPNEIAPARDKQGLSWRDIDVAARTITIRGAVAKTRTPRVIEAAPANLWAWLELTPPAERHGRVCHIAYELLRTRMRATGVELPPDVLRHSFASYAYHFLGAEKAVEMLGHVGGFRVFAKNYKSISNDKNARAYFSIFPPSK